jgi:hypothetical protein
MRRALYQNPSRGQVATARAVPAPVGGWDTESPLAAMPRQNAVILDNWIPRAGYVEFRRGYISHVVGVADPVESLIVWRGDAAGDKLFACSGTDIYDVSDSGPLGSALYGSAISARWRYTNFSNDAGAFAIAINGFNVPQKYNGTDFSDTVITGSSGPITLDPKDLSHVMAHKRRLFFIEKETLRVWYLAVLAIAGTAELLDIGPIFDQGGYLVAEGTWSLDGGQGMDDMAVFVTSEGQIAIYQGIDPSDADNWSLVGVYNIGKPVGENCLIKWGADLAVITQDGVVPLSQALDKNRERQKQIAITAKIATAFAESWGSYGGLYGWSGTLYSGRGSLAIFNIPTAELSTAVQYVQSIQTGAWCRFKGINAICWETANDQVYFGGGNGVYRWDIGGSDNGETITGDIKPAFSNFGSNVEKQFTMVRPLIKAPAIINPALEVLADYRESVPVSVQTSITAADLQDSNGIRYDWTSATATGYVATPRMRVSILGSPVADVVGVDADYTIIDGPGGDEILVSPDLPLDLEIQTIGFDLMFVPGGQL